MKYPALTRDEMRKVIEGRGNASRVPVLLHMWVHPDAFDDRKAQVLELFNEYPEDAQWIWFDQPGMFDGREDDPEYRWVNFGDPNKSEHVGHDAKVAINDWSQLEGVLANFADPNYKKALPPAPVAADGRYRIAAWWFCLFERHWSLRGMTNALMDYYTDPDSVHRLFRKLTDFYLVWLERAKREQNCDAIMTSDDIGMQTGPFFSVEIFREFFKPYYKELIAKAHSLDMHFWLHACGCIEKFLPDFIDIGLDVIHPIQKYTMDERKIAREFGGDITLWAGFDVQRIIPWGSPEDVRREVRFMMDTYARPEGRLLFTAGNGVNGDCTIPSLKALFDEAFSYGGKVVKKV